MPKYLVERRIPGVSTMSPGDLRCASLNSRAALGTLGPDIQWVHSYVAGDKLYCVYIAPDERLIREHASKARIPADAITLISSIIDPTTAEHR
jgi:hypothetical protein